MPCPSGNVLTLNKSLLHCRCIKLLGKLCTGEVNKRERDSERIRKCM
jgi:hypothetical protein